MKRCIVALALLFAVSTQLASASNIYITNASFEGVTASLSSPAGLSLSTNSGYIGAWQASASGLLGANSLIASGISNSIGGPAPVDGSYLAKFTLPLGLGYSTSLNQDLGVTFQPNSIYTLSVALAQPGASNLFANSTLSLKAGAATESSLGGTVLDSFLNGQNGFQTVSLTYQTPASAPSGDININFQDNSLLSFGSTVYADNFQLTVTPVDEPRSSTLFGTFVVIMASCYWRSKKSMVLPMYKRGSA